MIGAVEIVCCLRVVDELAAARDATPDTKRHRRSDLSEASVRHAAGRQSRAGSNSTVYDHSHCSASRANADVNVNPVAMSAAGGRRHRSGVEG